MVVVEDLSMHACPRVQVYYHGAAGEQVSTHEVRLPKDSCVADVLQALNGQLPEDKRPPRLRLLEVFYSKIYKVEAALNDGKAVPAPPVAPLLSCVIGLHAWAARAGSKLHAARFRSSTLVSLQIAKCIVGTCLGLSRDSPAYNHCACLHACPRKAAGLSNKRPTRQGSYRHAHKGVPGSGRLPDQAARCVRACPATLSSMIGLEGAS